MQRHCLTDQARPHIDEALSSMLDLLGQINTAMHQLHIAGFVVIIIKFYFFLQISFKIFNESFHGSTCDLLKYGKFIKGNFATFMYSILRIKQILSFF